MYVWSGPWRSAHRCVRRHGNHRPALGDLTPSSEHAPHARAQTARPELPQTRAPPRAEPAAVRHTAPGLLAWFSSRREAGARCRRTEARKASAGARIAARSQRAKCERCVIDSLCAEHGSGRALVVARSARLQQAAERLNLPTHRAQSAAISLAAGSAALRKSAESPRDSRFRGRACNGSASLLAVGATLFPSAREHVS